MDIEVTCPLGHVCEEAVDGKIRRCAWYVKLVGKDPQSNKEYDEWGCAIAWQPVLMTEVARTNRGQTQAIETFRNTVVKQNHLTQTILIEAANTKKALCSPE